MTGSRPHRRGPRLAIGLILVAVAIVPALTSCRVLDLVPLPPEVVYPGIEPVDDAQPVPARSFAWRFEGSTVRMEVPLDAAVLEGARRAPKTVLTRREMSEAEWIPGYYRAFIDEPHQEPLYEALLANFRSLRETLGLDGDRYAELIVSWVQTLPYRTDPIDLEPKFPIQTVGDGDGDCDDKTLLAAALLAREGYDVSMLLFAPEAHVALGIRSNGPPYGGSGYALVETTTPLLFGWVPDELDGEIVLTSEPGVIRIGEGARTYGAGDQTRALEELLGERVAVAERLTARIDELDAALQRQRAEVDELGTRMETLSSAGDISGYNALVPRYNAAADAYNTAVEERNAVAEELNGAGADIERIAEGQTDRRGLARSFLGR